MCKYCQGTFFYDVAIKRSMQRGILVSLMTRLKRPDPEVMQTLSEESSNLLDNNRILVFVSGSIEEHKK